MPVVIKEIIVKTKVEAGKPEEKELVMPPEWMERIREEIWREIDRHEYVVEPRRKER